MISAAMRPRQHRVWGLPAWPGQDTSGLQKMACRTKAAGSSGAKAAKLLGRHTLQHTLCGQSRVPVARLTAGHWSGCSEAAQIVVCVCVRNLGHSGWIHGALGVIPQRVAPGIAGFAFSMPGPGYDLGCKSVKVASQHSLGPGAQSSPGEPRRVGYSRRGGCSQSLMRRRRT